MHRYVCLSTLSDNCDDLSLKHYIFSFLSIYKNSLSPVQDKNSCKTTIFLVIHSMIRIHLLYKILSYTIYITMYKRIIYVINLIKLYELYVYICVCIT